MHCLAALPARIRPAILRSILRPLHRMVAAIPIKYYYWKALQSTSQIARTHVHVLFIMLVCRWNPQNPGFLGFWGCLSRPPCTRNYNSKIALEPLPGQQPIRFPVGVRGFTMPTLSHCASASVGSSCWPRSCWGASASISIAVMCEP